MYLRGGHMQTDIHYRDITRTDYLEAYLLGKIEGVVEKFMTHDADAHLTVRVETERHRTQNRRPVFICEVILKPTHSKRVVKVRKTNDDFYACVADTADALKKILQRSASRKAAMRRRSDGFESTFRNDSEETEEIEYKVS
jgi:ribosomal subunit interface protein